jgi:HSP20 family protein
VNVEHDLFFEERRFIMFLAPRTREKAERALTEFAPFERFRREFASLFERAFPGWLAPSETSWEMPWRLEMEEKDREVVVRAETPGFEAKELDVELRENVLTISAEHREEKKEPLERRHASWTRSVTLPSGIEPEKVEARYHNGVLEIHVPLTPEARPRRIDVKT